jgi:hypothetical protein
VVREHQKSLVAQSCQGHVPLRGGGHEVLLARLERRAVVPTGAERVIHPHEKWAGGQIDGPYGALLVGRGRRERNSRTEPIGGGGGGDQKKSEDQGESFHVRCSYAITVTIV